MTYQEYLKTPIWRKLKSVALRNADHRCQVCNFNGDLNVHHRVYPIHFGFEETNDLIVLCRSCHKLFHEAGRFKIPIRMTSYNFEPAKGSEIVYVPSKKDRFGRTV